MYVVKSEVRKFISKKKLRVSGNLWNAFDKKIAKILEDASARAKANKRMTVYPQDL